MSQLSRRFELAYERARTDWTAGDPVRCAERAGCDLSPAGVLVPYFGRMHVVPHPDGEVTMAGTGQAVHQSIAIVLLHYLLTADGAPPAPLDLPPSDRWLNFRQLPDGLFYSQAFAGHAEGLLASRFGSDVDAFRVAAERTGGIVPGLPPGAGLAPPDAAYQFQAFPRLAVIVQVWAGDEEFPGRAQVLFESHAGHYLPTEDLAGMGDWLAHKLSRA